MTDGKVALYLGLTWLGFMLVVYYFTFIKQL